MLHYSLAQALFSPDYVSALKCFFWCSFFHQSTFELDHKYCFGSLTCPQQVVLRCVIGVRLSKTRLLLICHLSTARSDTSISGIFARYLHKFALLGPLIKGRLILGNYQISLYISISAIIIINLNFWRFSRNFY